MIRFNFTISILTQSFLLDLIFPSPRLDFLSCSPTLPLDPFRPPFQGRLSLFAYSSLVRPLHQIKYQFATCLIPDLVNLSAQRLQNNFPHLLKFWQQNHYLFIPIPLHSYRQNWRGFNQSQLIGQSLAQKLHLNYSGEILIRRRHTSPQVSLSKSSRLTNLRSSFALKTSLTEGRMPEGQVGFKQDFILFDDVFTTGATLLSAAQALKPITKNLWALTLSA